MAAKRQTPRLRCPKCASAWTLAQVFDHCSVSWPNQRWLWFDCPKCQKGFHVEIEEGRATIGEIDGAPGPAFMPDNSVSVPGLTYNRGSGMTLRLGRRVWRVRGRF